MLKIQWRQIGEPDPLGRVDNARLKVRLDFIQQQCFRLTGLPILEGLGVASGAGGKVSYMFWPGKFGEATYGISRKLNMACAWR